MADLNFFSSVEELSETRGRVSVVTIEPGVIPCLPEAIIIDVYDNGKKVEEEEQRFETSDLGDDILGAKFEEKVYMSNDAADPYETMCDLARMYRDANGNLDVFSEMLDEHLHEKEIMFGEDEEDI